MAVQLIRGQTLGGTYYSPQEVVQGLTAAQEQQLVQGGDAVLLDNLTILDEDAGLVVLPACADLAAATAAAIASPMPAGSLLVVPLNTP